MFKYLNILKLFFEEPDREFGVREAARLLKISPATTSKELKKLANEGLLKGRKERIFCFYRADQENDYYKDLKLFYNTRKIRDSGLIDALNRFYLKPTIVFFGSGAAGLDTKTSDFDLLVLSEKTKSFEDVEAFEKRLNRRIHMIVAGEVGDIKNEHLVNNILNGIVLQGRIKWI